MSKQLIGQATAEQIEQWKSKHKDIFAITVDGHIAYLKRPDRKAISYASSIGAKDPIKFNEIILNNCWLGGSEEIKTDDGFFFGVSGKITELIQVKEAELVKL
jgi:hypothetical protein